MVLSIWNLHLFYSPIVLRPVSLELFMFPDFEFRTSLGTSILRICNQCNGILEKIADGANFKLLSVPFTVLIYMHVHFLLHVVEILALCLRCVTRTLLVTSLFPYIITSLCIETRINCVMFLYVFLIRGIRDKWLETKNTCLMNSSRYKCAQDASVFIYIWRIVAVYVCTQRHQRRQSRVCIRKWGSEASFWVGEVLVKIIARCHMPQWTRELVLIFQKGGHGYWMNKLSYFALKWKTSDNTKTYSLHICIHRTRFWQPVVWYTCDSSITYVNILTYKSKQFCLFWRKCSVTVTVWVWNCNSIRFCPICKLSPAFRESGGHWNSFVRLSVRLSQKTLTWLISFEVLMIEHWYLACMVIVTNPFYWYHAVTLTFNLCQGQICCRAGDHNSSDLLIVYNTTVHFNHGNSCHHADHTIWVCLRLLGIWHSTIQNSPYENIFSLVSRYGLYLDPWPTFVLLGQILS